VSKQALLALTVALADELGLRGIRVNAIVPGLVDNPAAAAEWPAERAIAIVDRQAIRRDGRMADLVPAFVYLASDDSAFVTGQTLTIDGGMPLGA
jgi:3-oxoacyl-[acyl-carrier protein] reductase